MNLMATTPFSGENLPLTLLSKACRRLYSLCSQLQTWDFLPRSKARALVDGPPPSQVALPVIDDTTGVLTIIVPNLDHE